MATDSVLGLFADPFQLAQQQSAATDQRAAQFARMSPMEQAQYGIYGGASRLAGGVAGLMGVQDPAMQRQAQRRALIQQVNMTDPASLVQAIRASSNDPELNSYLMGKYKELTGIQKEQSVIEKNKAWEASKTDSEKKRNLLSDVEQALSEGKAVDPADLNRARLAWAQETKPKTFQQPDGSIATVPGVDVNLFPNLGRALSSSGVAAPRMANTIETPASQAVKEKEIEAINSSVSNIDDSLNAVKGIKDVRTGSISTNPWLVDYAKKLPTGAKVQDNLLRTITAGKVIDTIMEMKQQSKTGATGFGALNGRELDQLEAKARTLDPASPAFETDLKYIEDKLIANKTKLQESLGKKQAAQIPQNSANWQNPQGNEGRLAILNAELAKATNPADIAGLQREIKALGGQPASLKGKMTDEQKIMATMADPRNKGRSRAEIEAALRKAGQIQ